MSKKKRNGVISGLLRVRGAAAQYIFSDCQPGIQVSLTGPAMVVVVGLLRTISAASASSHGWLIWIAVRYTASIFATNFHLLSFWGIFRGKRKDTQRCQGRYVFADYTVRVSHVSGTLPEKQCLGINAAYTQEEAHSTPAEEEPAYSEILWVVTRKLKGQPNVESGTSRPGGTECHCCSAANSHSTGRLTLLARSSYPRSHVNLPIFYSIDSLSQAHKPSEVTIASLLMLRHFKIRLYLTQLRSDITTVRPPSDSEIYAVSLSSNPRL
jgi:hypothetical protein